MFQYSEVLILSGSKDQMERKRECIIFPFHHQTHLVVCLWAVLSLWSLTEPKRKLGSSWSGSFTHDWFYCVITDPSTAVWEYLHSFIHPTTQNTPHPHTAWGLHWDWGTHTHTLRYTHILVGKHANKKTCLPLSCTYTQTCGLFHSYSVSHTHKHTRRPFLSHTKKEPTRSHKPISSLALSLTLSLTHTHTKLHPLLWLWWTMTKFA